MLETAMEELKKCLIDFYTITQTKIAVYDANKKFLYSYPEDLCSFCKGVRSNACLAKKCLDCDNVGFDACDKTGKPYIYKCHMNLVEAIAPIYENDIPIGYIMIGQMLNQSDVFQTLEKLKECCKRHKLCLPKMKNELMKLRPVSNDMIMSCVNIMSMCACYLYCNKIIKNNTGVIAYQINDYIHSHLRDDLNVSSISEQLYISRTKLYYTSVEAFEMGISDYVRKCRIEEAKRLLKECDRPISQIADEVGFKDANYFSRVFKSYESTTPFKYRKNNRKI